MGLIWLPNAVTIARCVLAIIVGYTILDMDTGMRAHRESGAWLYLPFAVFLVTAATDWLGGALARGLDAESRLGARLDPIADKLLTASSLLALCYIEGWAIYVAVPSIAIIGRDFLLTAMREALGNPSTLTVSRAAKWKTATALISIGCILFGMAISYETNAAEAIEPAWLLTRGFLAIGIAGLWITAVLSVITAVNYLSAAARDAR